MTTDGRRGRGASAGWVKIKRAVAWAATAATPALFAIAFLRLAAVRTLSRGASYRGIWFWTRRSDGRGRWIRTWAASTRQPEEGRDVERVVGVAVLLRLAFYACSVSLAVAFLRNRPSSRALVHTRGSRLMYAYLLHLLVIRSYELVRTGAA